MNSEKLCKRAYDEVRRTMLANWYPAISIDRLMLEPAGKLSELVTRLKNTGVYDNYLGRDITGCPND